MGSQPLPGVVMTFFVLLDADRSQVLGAWHHG